MRAGWCGGEAVAEVTATGTRTKFGRTAELVRTAHVTSSQQKAVLHVVRNLAAVNGCAALILVGYSYAIGMPLAELLPLITVIATVPVALPATFTLATALGAQALAKRGVLPTRLSAVDESASRSRH
jgi:H+-transporting ATPase